MFSFYIIGEYLSGVDISAELFVLVGGVSNVIDRFLYGGVIDFIDLYIGNYHWYTFNLADAYIVMGIIFIVLRSITHGYIRKG